MARANRLNSSDGPRFWWSQLCAVPPVQRCLEYDRLKRIWFDQTGARAWFRNSKSEAHLVATLFENMVLFEPGVWVPQVLAIAGVRSIPACVAACRWSYEFEDEENLKNGKPSIADLVACFRETAGEMVMIIEAKRGGGGLKAGDNDPDYYLGSPKLRDFRRRYMLYLIDEDDLHITKPPIAHDPDSRGVLTWQQLGGLQVSLANRLHLPDVHRNFIAGAIQYQFCQHGIRPATLVSHYLEREPSFEEMPTRQDQPGAQQKEDRRIPMWRCDWE